MDDGLLTRVAPRPGTPTNDAPVTVLPLLPLTLRAFIFSSRVWAVWRAPPAKVFNWLVGKINEAHTSGAGAAVAETVAFVGILDIFGNSVFTFFFLVCLSLFLEKIFRCLLLNILKRVAVW